MPGNRSTRRIIRETLKDILENPTADSVVRLKAVRLLLKVEASKKKCKPRGRPFQKKQRLSVIDRLQMN